MSCSISHCTHDHSIPDSLEAQGTLCSLQLLVGHGPNQVYQPVYGFSSPVSDGWLLEGLSMFPLTAASVRGCTVAVEVVGLLKALPTQITCKFQISLCLVWSS